MALNKKLRKKIPCQPNPINFNARLCVWLDPTTLFMTQSNSTKCKFLGKFDSHDTIHILKNYFVTVFLIISSLKTSLITVGCFSRFRDIKTAS